MRPFGDGDTCSTFKLHLDKLMAEISALDNDYILKASQTELEQHFIDKGHISPLVLHSDQKYIAGQQGVGIDVSHEFTRAVFPGERAIVQGTRLDLAIPYDGDQLLWRLRPSTFTLSGYPEISVKESTIVISFQFPDDSANPDRLKNDVDRVVKSLEEALGHIREDVQRHNASLHNLIISQLERKRTLARAATGAVTSLGIPFKRAGSQPSFIIPTTRRPSPAKRPDVSAGSFQPEPELDLKEYDFILDVMRGMSLVIERNPTSFEALDEESIRDHFLIQLNGHYEGGASGETFNAAGKTDILIRVGDRNVFVAECKFWRGPKYFAEAADQLLGYLSWRDSKCALLIFNQNKESSTVLTKMHEIMTSRPEHRKTIVHSPERDSRYVFVKASDPGREITITTQCYDIPKK
ncbi:MAG: hypothetical protein IMZ62_13135 [Chloroflexi bacterium]|nr:hypothetical protein [Chloroflexota bacterium]